MPFRNYAFIATTAKKGACVAVSGLLALSLGLPISAVAYAEGADDPAAAQAAAEPDFDGYDVVQKYLDGQTPTLAELERVDFDALRLYDADLAKRLGALLESLKEEAIPDGPDAEPPASGEEPDEPDAPAGSDAEAPAVPADPGTLADPGAPEAPADVDPGLVAEATFADVEVAALADVVAEPEWSYEGDDSFTMVHYTEDMTSQKLIAAIGEPAREVAQEYGVSASEMIALAVVNSKSGRGNYAQAPYRNLFEHRAYVAVDATEYDDAGIAVPGTSGVAYQETDEVCEYATYKECLADHAARVAAGAVESIPDDGVLGGPEGSLTKRVQDTIEAYDLQRYDVPLDYQTSEPLVVKQWDEALGDYVDAEVSLTDLVAEVTSHLGVPYVWGGTTPSGFDCSGLVQYSYAEALQMALPRVARAQCLTGADVDFNDLHMGDLLFFADRNGVCVHVAMYLGEGCYIEAPQPGEEVKLTAMDEKRPTFAKRLVSTMDVPDPEPETAAAELEVQEP